MKKRVVSCMVAAMMVFALTACGQKEEAPSEPEAVQVEESEDVDEEQDLSEEVPVSEEPEAQEPEEASEDSQKPQEEQAESDANTLVIYFSATGNTREVAGYIADILGADLYEIVPEEPYTSDDLDWTDSSSRVSLEHEDPDMRPAVGGEAVELDNYERVFLGYPIWWGEAPNIVRTFMESADLSGKTIIPFCTSSSSALGSSAENLEVFAPDADWQEGQRFGSSATEEEVANWVNSLKGDMEAVLEDAGVLQITQQGMFSAGGTVTEPVEGEYDPTTNWLDPERPGNTAHVDHANVFYQIPAADNGNPIVYLHGYGQSRMGWMTTPDGREGWSNMFLKNGHAAFLVDQPRRGEAGAAVSMTTDGFLDAWAEDSKEYRPGDQAWYTHFRIGRVAPERYEGSQFPEGDEAQDQFFRQMTPNTGDFDQAVDAAALGAVLKEVQEMTGNKSIYMTHSQGGAVGWDTPVENISAIVAIEPGGTPEVGSEQYNRLLQANIPIVIYFGDYIDNGPEDIASTAFWKGVRDGALQFMESYNADGGDCTVVDLPKEGITGNSHFMFQEMNNDVIAEHIENWLTERGLN